MLIDIIDQAKTMYPTEDGWLVLNETRLQNLNIPSATMPSYESTAQPQSDFGAGSLAEAIAMKNSELAFALIENRPMVALADAASEYTSLLAVRQGVQEANTVSALLAEKTSQVNTTDIRNVLTALSSAVDGTESDEHLAVRRAIKQAIEVLS